MLRVVCCVCVFGSNISLRETRFFSRSPQSTLACCDFVLFLVPAVRYGYPTDAQLICGASKSKWQTKRMRIARNKINWKWLYPFGAAGQCLGSSVRRVGGVSSKRFASVYQSMTLMCLLRLGRLGVRFVANPLNRVNEERAPNELDRIRFGVRWIRSRAGKKWGLTHV